MKRLPIILLVAVSALAVLMVLGGAETARAAPGPQIQVSPLSINFGTWEVSPTEIVRTVFIKNIGDADLVINGFATANPFHFDAEVPLPPPLAPDEEIGIEVWLRCDAEGNFNGVFLIGWLSPAEETVEVELIGSCFLALATPTSVPPTPTTAPPTPPPPPPPPVGGIAFVDSSDSPASSAGGSGPSALTYAGLAGAVAAGMLAVVAGGWYGRRRFRQ